MRFKKGTIILAICASIGIISFLILPSDKNDAIHAFFFVISFFSILGLALLLSLAYIFGYPTSLKVDSSGIHYNSGKNSKKIEWEKIKRVTIKKSTVKELPNWWKLHSALVMGNTYGGGTNAPSIMSKAIGDLEIIWLIEITFQGSEGMLNKISYTKKASEKDSLLLLTIIQQCKRAAIPIEIDEYLRDNDWFRKKYLA